MRISYSCFHNDRPKHEKYTQAESEFEPVIEFGKREIAD